LKDRGKGRSFSSFILRSDLRFEESAGVQMTLLNVIWRVISGMRRRRVRVSLAKSTSQVATASWIERMMTKLWEKSHSTTSGNLCESSNYSSYDCGTCKRGSMSDECSKAMKLSDLLLSSQPKSRQVLQYSSTATTILKPSGRGSLDLITISRLHALLLQRSAQLAKKMDMMEACKGHGQQHEVGSVVGHVHF